MGITGNNSSRPTQPLAQGGGPCRLTTGNAGLGLEGSRTVAGLSLTYSRNRHLGVSVSACLGRTGLAQEVSLSG